MSWLVIAKKEFQDAVRARVFWLLSGLFMALVLLISGVYVYIDEVADADQSTLGLIFFIASALGLFVSLTALVVCYKSIAGERESGSMKILLSLPHSRLDVVLGKILGRSGVLAIPVAVALFVGAVVGTVALNDVEIIGTVAFTLVGLLYVMTYVSIFVGLSATTGSTNRAASLSVGFFLILELFWGIIVTGVAFIQAGFEFVPPSEYPEWAFILSQIQPSSAFGTALVAVIPDAPRAAFGSVPAEQVDAIYATPWLGLVMLLVWLVVPPVIGYMKLEKADL